MRNDIKVIAFDADDTLWINHSHFLWAENEFYTLLKDYMPENDVSRELFLTEMNNLHLYGYGVKGFMLSMIETICKVAADKAKSKLFEKAIIIGKELLQKPIELLDGVEFTLQQLQEKYRLIVATKGDLLDQERKIQASSLQGYFHHIEIMSDKNPADFKKLLRHLDCPPEQFLMIGNSIKSDILPVLELGGFAAYIPFLSTWEHEKHNEELQHSQLLKLSKIDDILNYLN